MKEALKFAVAFALIVTDELSASLTDDGQHFLLSVLINFIEPLSRMLIDDIGFNDNSTFYINIKLMAKKAELWTM